MAGGDRDAPLVWGLLGHRRGDNQQVTSLGAALGGRFETKQLRYTPSSRLPNVLRRSHPLGVHADPGTPIAPPWPDVVIAVGRRSVPLALAIREAAHGRCRLVQIGRPGAPLDWFDLVVTTPQYDLPAAANVVTIPLPFGTNPPGTPSPASAPPGTGRPLLVVLAGGPTAELELSVADAVALAAHARRRADDSGGNLAVVTSPRTPPEIAAALVAQVPPPHSVHVWQPNTPSPYADLLAAADQVLVTGDSVSMLADACRGGAAVDVYPLRERVGVVRRLAEWARAAAARHEGGPARWLALPFTTGVRKAPRRYAAVHDELVRRGLLGPGACSAEERRAAISVWETAVVDRVRALLPPAARASAPVDSGRDSGTSRQSSTATMHPPPTPSGRQP